MSDERRWRVDRTINLGDMLTLLGMFVTMLAFVGAGWLHLQTRIDGVNNDLKIHAEKIANIEKMAALDREDVQEKFDYIISLLRDVRSEVQMKADKK